MEYLMQIYQHTNVKLASFDRKQERGMCSRAILTLFTLETHKTAHLSTIKSFCRSKLM